MTTRLDRLFVLLENGTSALTRKAAAEQLGDVQKLHPHELYSLLDRLHAYLHSGSWECRIAAGQAVQAVLGNLPQWNPTPRENTDSDQPDLAFCADSNKLPRRIHLTVETFSVERVLASNPLLTSVQQAHDDSSAGADVSVQRSLINKRLGLDAAVKLGIDTSDIVSNQDLVWTSDDRLTGDPGSLDAAVPVSSSSREANRLRRKHRDQMNKRSAEASGSSVRSGEPPDKKMKCESSTPPPRPLSSYLSCGNWEESVEWPLEGFCDMLLDDLMSERWETRHGAATALRETLRVHGSGAGRCLGQTQRQMDNQHRLRLEDIALRIVSVLTLDRFGDYISDQVVAPVRESAAQALGAVFHLLPIDSVSRLASTVFSLLARPEWQVRHGGQLALKYLLAVRLNHELTPLQSAQLLEAAIVGMSDPCDDVSAVAASALVQCSDTLVQLLPSSRLSIVLSTLWDALVELDELMTSTPAMMQLLAALSSRRSTLHQGTLSTLVVRLWPFMCHMSSTVRLAAAQTLNQLTHTQDMLEWRCDVIQMALRLTFQRVLLEDKEDIVQVLIEVWLGLIGRTPLATLLTATCPLVATWLCMLMQPTRVAYASNVLVLPQQKLPSQKEESNHVAVGGVDRDGQQSAAGSNVTAAAQYLGGPAAAAMADGWEREALATRGRLVGARLLGELSPYIVQPMPGAVYAADASPVSTYVTLLSSHLTSRSALQRGIVGHLVAEWIQATAGGGADVPVELITRLSACLLDQLCYDESAVAFARLQQDCRDYMAQLKHYKLSVDPVLQSVRVLSFDQIELLVGSMSDAVLDQTSGRLQVKVFEKLQTRRLSVKQSAHQVSTEQAKWTSRTQLALARAIIASGRLPEKLTPVVRPLIDTLKREVNVQLQTLAADSLVVLLELSVGRDNSPVPKIIRNLCVYSCCDPMCTPHVAANETLQQTGVLNGSADRSAASSVSRVEQSSLPIYSGIISLDKMQQMAEEKLAKSCGGAAAPSDAVVTNGAGSTSGECQLAVQRRGAGLALTAICRRFGELLPEQLTQMSLAVLDESPSSPDHVQRLVNALQITEIISPSVTATLVAQMFTYLPHLRECLHHQYTAVRHMASRCLSAFGLLHLHKTLTFVVEYVLPMLGDPTSVACRQGAVEAVGGLLQTLGLRVLPYLCLLVVPVMGRMSDRDDAVRQFSSEAFARLVQLMPLEPGCPDRDQLPVRLHPARDQQRRFLDQLMDPSCIESEPLSVTVRADLRPYQQRGVAWLLFLSRYQLHGVLCDDMGLGKSLQSLCVLADDTHTRRQRFANTGAAQYLPLPSLIVCPPTLTGHWMYEIEKFVEPGDLNPLHYCGLPLERVKLRAKLCDHDLVVASYDIVRKDIDFFSGVRWNYCILDEGHIIKNGRTKVSRAIKQLDAAHRLVLTGTPLQNSVVELWSLFDFLMPGFLGTERQFTARYGRPILLSRDAKANSREQEAGALALESLHRQVLPFMLRRLKEDVLDDLPPKITQDYCCQLSDVQRLLYEDFSRSPAQSSLVAGLEGAESNQHRRQQDHHRAPTHVFQALQYLRKVCNHPKLVLTAEHPSYAATMALLRSQNSSLDRIQHSTKLLALKQLLIDLGIGAEESSSPSGGPPQTVVAEPAVHPHRALIFCQLKSMLDIVERDLLRAHLPSVTYLRLDGSVPAADRHQLVHRFNTDASIDCLLLTTQVGGLGLNLIGADTVIFVEHDWNPMKDLQAMDRVHRIGQKRVVNVYRLITSGTLEEKIMGLQRFKLATANSVVTSDNSSLLSMGTSQLFDLFTLESKKSSSSSCSSAADGVRSVLESLPDLWDDDDYEQEYDLSGFLKTLKS